MSTQIQWTDETWNPVTGCSKVSPGCAHCYAETVALRFWPSQYPPVEYETYSVDNCCQVTEQRRRQFTDVLCHEDRLEQPLHWRRPRKVFVNSMSDLFHEDVPDAFVDHVFAVMALAPQHTFQVLTKRAERMRDYVVGLTRRHTPDGNMLLSPSTVLKITAAELVGGVDWMTAVRQAVWPLPNVWLGVSVENQHFADERIPLLLQTPAAVRFISAEPLLGPVDLGNLRGNTFDALTGCGDRERLDEWDHTPRLNWVIVGGESGPGARPFEVAWARSIVRQCRNARVPVFCKQLGAHVIDRNDAGFEGDTPTSWPMDTDYDEDIHGYRDVYQGAPVRVRLGDRKGGAPSEWPSDLNIREFPKAIDGR